MNKEISPKELINGHPFQSDSYTTPACVTIMYLLTLKQCYSSRYQNILMWWNAGWNIIATSQQTETSWDNCTAKENRLSLQMPLQALSFIFQHCIIWCNNDLMSCSQSAPPILWYPLDTTDCTPSVPIHLLRLNCRISEESQAEELLSFPGYFLVQPWFIEGGVVVGCGEQQGGDQGPVSPKSQELEQDNYLRRDIKHKSNKYRLPNKSEAMFRKYTNTLLWHFSSVRFSFLKKKKFPTFWI